MLRLCLLFTTLGVMAAFAAKETLYLEDHCGKFGPRKVTDTLEFRLSNERANSSNRATCILLFEFRARKDTPLLMTIYEISLNASKSNCANQFLEINTGNSAPFRWCYHQNTAMPQVLILKADKDSGTSLVYSRSEPLSESDRVRIVITPANYTDKNGTCPILGDSINGTFKCESENLCIPEMFRCDEVEHCVEGSDEDNCTGMTTMTTLSPSLSQQPDVVVSPEFGHNVRTTSKLDIVSIIGAALVCIVLVVLIVLGIVKYKKRYQSVPLAEVSLRQNAT